MIHGFDRQEDILLINTEKDHFMSNKEKYMINNNFIKEEIVPGLGHIPFISGSFVESNPMPIKWIMYKLNKIENNIRLPLINLNETFHEQIEFLLLKLKLL